MLGIMDRYNTHKQTHKHTHHPPPLLLLLLLLLLLQTQVGCDLLWQECVSSTENNLLRILQKCRKEGTPLCHTPCIG